MGPWHIDCCVRVRGRLCVFNNGFTRERRVQFFILFLVERANNKDMLLLVACGKGERLAGSPVNARTACGILFSSLWHNLFVLMLVCRRGPRRRACSTTSSPGKRRKTPLVRDHVLGSLCSESAQAAREEGSCQERCHTGGVLGMQWLFARLVPHINGGLGDERYEF